MLLLPPRLTFSRLTRLEHGFNCVPWLPGGRRRITDPRPLTLGRIPEYVALQKLRIERRREGRDARVQKKIRASEVRMHCVVTTLPRRRRERGERAAKKHGDLLVNAENLSNLCNAREKEGKGKKRATFTSTLSLRFFFLQTLPLILVPRSFSLRRYRLTFSRETISFVNE